MPTAINPNDYNVEFFQSQIFGEITNINYLNYLFNYNLQDLPEELVNSPAGNFTNQYEEKGTLKQINYGSLTNPGSVDEWFVNGSFTTNLFEISYQNPNQNVGTNQYGPPSLQAFNYENPTLIADDTGFIQYPTSSGGGALSNLLSLGLNAVGISSTNFINFDSPLNDIAKEQRKQEVKNRVRDGIIENTVGRINLDPLGLLAGQPLFAQDYKITRPADGNLGTAINAIEDIFGTNIQALTTRFGGPLPKGSLDWDSPLSDPFSNETIDISEGLLNRTGKGTKNLIFKSLTVNKYGPIIEGQDNPTSSPPKAKDSNQPPQKGGYLGYGDFIDKQKVRSTEEQLRNEELNLLKSIGSNESNLIDKFGPVLINSKNTRNQSSTNKTSKLPSLDDLKTDRESRPDLSLQPTESDNPNLNISPQEVFRDKGFEFENVIEQTYDNVKSGIDFQHKNNWRNQYYPPNHLTPNPNGDNGLYGPEFGARWNEDLYWKDGRQTGLPKRGLLSYTQKLINKSTNVPGSSARFIGLPNSDQNYDNAGGDRRHTTMSMGNLVKETKENKYYCRSWSVRNAYNTYNDLIRKDGLWRESQPGTIGTSNTQLNSYSTLREPGIPKIAWEHDDKKEIIINNKVKDLKELTIGKEYIIPYMFSIENLAWKDSPHYDKLPPCERGPHGGRIMWFPPYNISFTDNTTANWDTTSFIGRGEPIYTYNNTERSGTLSFTIIVDHPSVLNKIKDNYNLETFFAGCSSDEIKEIVNEAFKEIVTPQEQVIEEIKPREVIIPEAPKITETLSFHFKNARSANILEKQEKTSNYANKDIIINSSCPDGVVGRCFDYNYEKDVVTWYDNLRLYKGGSNKMGSNGECISQSNILIIENNPFGELVEIPLSGTTTRPIQPPCNGKNFQKYGPKTSVVKELEDGNESNRDELWSNKGKAYDDENYCCEITLSAYTFNSITYTDFSRLGFFDSRNAANGRFWGTMEYPITLKKYHNNSVNTSPTLLLPLTPEGGWKFQVSGEAPTIVGPAGTGISQLIEFLATTSMGKQYTIVVQGNASNSADNDYNTKLAKDRADAVYSWMRQQMIEAEKLKGVPKLNIDNNEPIDLFSEESKTKTDKCRRWSVISKGNKDSQSLVPGNNNRNTASNDFILTPSASHPGDWENEIQLAFRRVDIILEPNNDCVKEYYDKLNKQEQEKVEKQTEELIKKKNDAKKAEEDKLIREQIERAKNFVNECDYFQQIKKNDSFLYDSISEKIKNFHPAFHSITPEGFNSRITFLQQCGRQGPSFVDPNQPQNTVFGRPPVCILRVGDFYFTKIIIDSINFAFDPLQWDLNPEGIGVQPMLVNVDLGFKFIGGSTLQGPLTHLQNAVSYNFFANTALYMPLEKILDDRSKFGKTYYYGPWGSPPQDTNDKTTTTNKDEDSKASNESDKDDLIDGGELSEESIKINKEVEDGFSEAGKNTPELNKTSEDGSNIFIKSQPVTISSGENSFVVEGQAFNGIINDEDSPLLGFIPRYVYGVLKNEYNTNFDKNGLKYYIDSTFIEKMKTIDGKDITDTQSYGIVDNIQEDGRIPNTNLTGFIFDPFYDLFGFISIDSWKNAYDNSEEDAISLLNKLTTIFEKNNKTTSSITYGVNASPLVNGEINRSKSRISSEIKVSVSLDKTTFNTIKSLLTQN